MTVRTVRTDDGTEWTLAPAVGSDDERDAADGSVPVVATPDGGSQTVRLALPPDWNEAMDDDALASAIEAARG